MAKAERALLAQRKGLLGLVSYSPFPVWQLKGRASSPREHCFAAFKAVGGLVRYVGSVARRPCLAARL